MPSNTLTIGTNNTHRYQQGEVFLKNNVNKFDVFCLQEHWLILVVCVSLIL